MAENIKEKFGERSLKYLGYWTLMFFFYRFFLDTTLVTTIALVGIFILVTHLVNRVVFGRREAYDEYDRE